MKKSKRKTKKQCATISDKLYVHDPKKVAKLPRKDAPTIFRMFEINQDTLEIETIDTSKPVPF